METPNPVLVHNADLGLKGTQGELLRISEKGYYELILKFGDNGHRVLLPISATVVIARDPEIDFDTDLDIER